VVLSIENTTTRPVPLPPEAVSVVAERNLPEGSTATPRIPPSPGAENGEPLIVDRAPVELMESPSIALVERSAAYKNVPAGFTAMLTPLLPAEDPALVSDPLLLSISRVVTWPPRVAA
jgi:hypothetical protein